MGIAVDATDVAPTESPVGAPAGPSVEAPEVVVEAWDAWTVFGGLEETWAALLAGRAIDDHTRIATTQFGRAAMGRKAGRQAIRQARSVAARVAAGVATGIEPGAAVVVGTSKGSVEDWLAAAPPGRSTSDNPAGVVRASGLADISAAVARSLRLSGPRLTVSAACASGLHALIRGAMMIRSGEATLVLVVATEASIHPLFLANFRRLGVLAQPGDGCRPFDRNRTGFYMSDAAAAVLLRAATPTEMLRLRRPDEAVISRNRPMVFLDRFAMGGDATHLTGGDPQARVMKRLLADVIDGRRVDMIHAHGTGTTMNDAAELAAIEASVGRQEQSPVVYSHKGALGHSLGASGLLSVVLNCLSHETGVVPPNARTPDAMATQRVTIPFVPTERVVERSMAIAAGFGGPIAVVSLTSSRQGPAT